jgi:23S rRNA (guanosine2251-2'-O)-methyltransferase
MTDGGDEFVSVRCPNPACRARLSLPASRLGRNEPCPSCGQVITVVPIAFQERAATERARALSISSSRGGLLRERLDACASAESRHDLMPVAVVLENVRSLWNVGSIFRTADAMGVEEIWLTGFTGRPPRKEISKTALGAEEAVPWRQAPGAAEAVETLRAAGRAIVALETAADAVDIRQADVRFPCAVLLGHEVAGLSDSALALADIVCRIPMHGIKGSLNVAVAAGVALWELRCQAEKRGLIGR